METLAALGLASNIVQFVTFAGDLFSNAKTVYKSALQASPNAIVLRDVANDLIRLSEDVIVPNSPGDDELKKLALRAKEAASSLLTLLNDLQIKGRKTRWKSFLLAANEVRNREAIKLITDSIVKLQTEIMLHIQLQIQSGIVSLSANIARLETQSKKLHINNTRELHGVRDQLLSAFESVHDSCGDQSKKRDIDIVRDLNLKLDQLKIEDIQTIHQRLSDYTSNITTLSGGLDTIKMHQDIISVFHFDKIASREQQVSKAHATTFEWILRGSLPDRTTKINFPSWLRSGNNIFWIRGKAGSGKSTLMKFISYHPTTVDYLKHWSGSQHICLGSFYFWNSGTDLQKSQEGLLQSLIFEILRQFPELATHAWTTLLDSKDKMRNSLMTAKDGITTPSEKIGPSVGKGNGETWTVRQLTETLESLLDHDDSRKFCFFIDGLDEYKAKYTQDHQYLIDALRKMANSPNVKICVSSRPWTVFLNEFDGDSSRCLKLEDFTRDDIRSFATDKLSGHNQFHILSQKDPSYVSLIYEVVARSQGVFLWVFLVVRELLDGLTYNDTINTMQRRLEAFPGDLEQFFQHMLDSVPMFYRPQMRLIFQMSTSAPHPIPMIVYSFLEEVRDNPHWETEGSHQPCRVHEIPQHQKTVQKRLDACCKGLLEVTNCKHSSPPSSYDDVFVDFLHRTVRDYLTSGTIADISEQPAPERRNNWLLICNAIVLTIAGWSRFQTNVLYGEEQTLDMLVLFAKKAQIDGAESQTINRIILDGYESFYNDRCSIVQDTGLSLTISLIKATYSHDLVSSVPNVGNFQEIVSELEQSAGSIYCDQDLILSLASYAETNGYSSKVVLGEYFRRIIKLIVGNRNSGWQQFFSGREGFVEIMKAIASTGYEIDPTLMGRYLPELDTQISRSSSVYPQRKRALKEDKIEGTSRAVIRLQPDDGQIRSLKRLRTGYEGASNPPERE
ncbi:hypothetical protein F4777DRAFT_562276 [Nemania sp. FL0916]|nr:hypothetical protein F4777DRAFT_562276 [Nemania sp. FL0916]